MDIESFETAGFKAPSANPFSLFISYAVPDAHAHAWSLPTAKPNSSEWQEAIPVNIYGGFKGEGTALAAELTGTDYAAQATDSQHTLVAGVLFGVAGGAAVVAFQMLFALILKLKD